LNKYTRYLIQALALPCGLEEGAVLPRTAVKALRSEYLAWPTANIVEIELLLKDTTRFERKKLQLNVIYSWTTMLRLTAGRYRQWLGEENTARTSGPRAKNTG